MNVLKPNQRATVYTLLERKTSQREIARITGIDRKTVRSYDKHWQAERSNSRGVATAPVAPAADQITPPRPPASTLDASASTTSLCEPHRAFIETQLKLGRNATAVYQEMVDVLGFAGRYNSVKRFVARSRVHEPEQFDRIAPLQLRGPASPDWHQGAGAHLRAPPGDP